MFSQYWKGGEPGRDPGTGNFVLTSQKCWNFNNENNYSVNHSLGNSITVTVMADTGRTGHEQAFCGTIWLYWKGLEELEGATNRSSIWKGGL